MATETAGYHKGNIFKKMSELKFEQTISDECGITMNDSVEARAIADFMEKQDGVTVTYQPALIRIDGKGTLTYKMDEISEELGKEMTVEMFEVNTSTHYARMVKVEDNTIRLYGNIEEMFEFIE
jgi:propane monooxygenase coupling protein